MQLDWSLKLPRNTTSPTPITFIFCWDSILISGGYNLIWVKLWSCIQCFKCTSYRRLLGHYLLSFETVHRSMSNISNAQVSYQLRHLLINDLWSSWTTRSDASSNYYIKCNLALLMIKKFINCINDHFKVYKINYLYIIIYIYIIIST